MTEKPSRWNVAISASALFVSLLTALFVYLQYLSSETQRQHFKDQIRYVVSLQTDDANGRNSLTVAQVSGDPYILDEIYFWPSVDDGVGGYLNAKPFKVNLMKYYRRDDGLPLFVISDVGQLICDRARDFEGKPCEPDADFTVQYRYNVFDDARPYRQALTEG